MTEFVANLSSPTDWPESWLELRTIDSLLRCSICSEFFNSATVVPSCSHNYCSLCIRKSLAVRSKCPSCDVSVKDNQLENNRIIDEIVKSFLNLRNQLLEVVKKNATNLTNAEKIRKSKLRGNHDRSSMLFGSSDSKGSTQPPKTSNKRQRNMSRSPTSDPSPGDASPPVSRKKQRRRSDDEDHRSSNDDDEICIIEKPTSQKSIATTSRDVQKVPNVEKEDLVDCPVCCQKVPESKINSHLDSCLTSKDRKDNLRSTSSQSSSSLSQNADKVSSLGANSFIPQVTKRKPLNKLVYTILSDKKLKDRLKEHGLSIKGDRQTLVKRHQEFTLIYNSECNKARPKSVSEIVRLVEEGEKKKKKLDNNREKLNFDRGQSQEEIDKMKDDYITQNQHHFNQLIREIRSRKRKTENTGSEQSDVKSPGDPRSRRKGTPLKKRTLLGKKMISSDDESDSNSALAGKSGIFGKKVVSSDDQTDSNSTPVRKSSSIGKKVVDSGDGTDSNNTPVRKSSSIRKKVVDSGDGTDSNSTPVRKSISIGKKVVDSGDGTDNNSRPVRKNILLGKEILGSDDETASNSSADFEITGKRFSTPGRKLKKSPVSTQKRRITRLTRSTRKNVKDDSSDVNNDQPESNVSSKDTSDPEMSPTVPDPPSPSMLEILDGTSDQNSSGSESLLTAFGLSSPTTSGIPVVSTNENGYESEEIEF